MAFSVCSRILYISGLLPEYYKWKSSSLASAGQDLSLACRPSGRNIHLTISGEIRCKICLVSLGVPPALFQETAACWLLPCATPRRCRLYLRLWTVSPAGLQGHLLFFSFCLPLKGTHHSTFITIFMLRGFTVNHISVHIDSSRSLCLPEAVKLQKC